MVTSRHGIDRESLKFCHARVGSTTTSCAQGYELCGQLGRLATFLDSLRDWLVRDVVLALLNRFRFVIDAVVLENACSFLCAAHCLDFSMKTIRNYQFLKVIFFQWTLILGKARRRAYCFSQRLIVLEQPQERIIISSLSITIFLHC